MRNPIVLLLIASATLASCGKSVPPPPIPERDTMNLPAQVLTIHTILTHGNDSTLAAQDTTTDFDIRDTIHGLIRTENAIGGTSLVGRWYYVKTGQKIAENSATLSAGTNLSHFDLMNENPWPLGKYKLLVIVDTVVKDSAEFVVEYKR
ncbi:MAG: hypothetical protein ACHQNE_00800 [Candidatus Kapaibacterium sp.]